MKLLSEYVCTEKSKTSKVYQRKENEYTVVVKDDLGNSYTCEFDSLQKAEYYAENWVIKYE
jgi:hypothetical protein